MNTSYSKDFTYHSFSVSRYNLEEYLKALIASRSKLSMNRGYFYEQGLLQSMIYAISTNDVKFNPKDHELCRILEQIIIHAGYESNGQYMPEAHIAMRNLCIMQGKNPDNHILHDKTIGGTVDKIKSKVKNLFGFGKKKKPEESTPIVNQTQVNMKHTEPTKKNKVLLRMTTALTGIMTLGSIMLITSDEAHAPDKSNTTGTAPTFKTISVDAPHHNAIRTYNIANAFQSQNITQYSIPGLRTEQMEKTLRPVIKQEAPAATDSVSIKLTQASKSALDILLGGQKADRLCKQIQDQIDAGIFAAPNGMSVERIAHAMTMSRIYEGKSIILTALQSKTKLTPEEQSAFNRHIDEIGDMGVKLQKRMAAKHKLSKHSKFNHANKSVQKIHVKNLKQLKQMQKMMHTR